MAKSKEKIAKEKLEQAAEAIAGLPPSHWPDMVIYLLEAIGNYRDGWSPAKQHDFMSRMMHEVGQEVMKSFKELDA